MQMTLSELRALIHEVAGDENCWSVLKKNVGNYVHFTDVQKLGINPHPSVQDQFNPKGLYGIPITNEFIAELSNLFGRSGYVLDSLKLGRYMNRKFMYIFSIDDDVKLLDLHKNSADIKRTLGLHGAALTKKLLEMGFDGVYSTGYGLSGDVEEEVVVFPPYSKRINVIDALKNSLVYDVSMEYLENDFMHAPKESRPQLKSRMKYIQRARANFMHEAWYDHEHGENSLLDDESYGDESVLVPADIKGSIAKWAKEMGLKK